MNVVALALQKVSSVGAGGVVWLGLLLCVWRAYCTLKQGFSYVKRLHQIPCNRCIYFTGDYRLKCTVHPMFALTEEAIGCMDYASKSSECGGLYT